MPLVKRRAYLIMSLGWAQLAFAQSPEGVSEKDFLEDMPIVLSVSRLPQRLDETPGAVTILDRNMIRLSGARDVADLLRLVPGFQTSMSFENVAPLASYHGGFDGYSNRVQVLVDGRSVFSPYFIGSIGPGLQTVALADIERIEVLRGSNSAAYGARAFLGVINIVTRDTLDTMGLQASLTGGEVGIRDAQARIGWGQQDARF
jgi:iron complex outermembrane receptor protein